MDREKLQRRLLGIFLNELEGHVVTLRDGLSALERGEPDSGEERRLTVLRRAAHTVKGAARSAGVPLVQAVGYAMERILRAAEEDRRALDGGLLRLLASATDALDDARGRLSEQRGLEECPLASLLPALEEQAERSARAT